MPVLSSYVLDNGLQAIDALADKIYVCSQEPTTYAEATTTGTYALGVKDFGSAGGAINGTMADATPNGRKVVTNAIAGGTILQAGTVVACAVVDSANSRLLATSSVTPLALTGSVFNMNAFAITEPARDIDSSTAAWVSAVLANSGTVSAPHRAAVDNFIIGAKAYNLWTKFDRAWLWASFNDGIADALVDIVGGNIATLVGSPPYALGGFTGDDLVNPVNCINTNFNHVTQGVAFTLNSAHVAIWNVTDPAQINGSCDASNDLNYNAIDVRDHDPAQTYFSINDSFAGFTAPTGTPADAHGHWVLTRTGPTQSDVYGQGSFFMTNPFNGTSIIGTSRSWYALAGRDYTTGAALYGTSRQQGMLTFGAGLSATDAANFFNIAHTYMQAAGVA